MSRGTDASRRFVRLEPLPEVFALARDETASSRLHRRVVFIALRDSHATRDLRDTLTLRYGPRLTSSRLFAAGMEAPWHMFQLSSDVGLAPLLRWSEFLAFQRQLADDLLHPAAGAQGAFIDWSPDHADARSVATMCALFPDALIVVDATVADALPAALQSRVQVHADDDATLAAVNDAIESAPAPTSTPADLPPSPLQNRLVVVLGCGRSGTTWLQQLWLAHPRVAGAPGNETWLFHQLRLLWRAYDEGTGFAGWHDRPTFVAALRRYCDNVLGTVRERFGGAGADYVVEKTPAHVYQLAHIAAVYPDAWMVHLLRDGRDVARSIAQVPFFDVPDIGAAASVWKQAVNAVRRDQHAVPRFREIRYEELAREPAATMRDLWTWVGLDAADGDQPALGIAVDTPVSSHRRESGTWSRGHSRSDLAKIYRHAGRTLVREGYGSRSAVWRSFLIRPGRS